MLRTQESNAPTNRARFSGWTRRRTVAALALTSMMVGTFLLVLALDWISEPKLGRMLNAFGGALITSAVLLSLYCFLGEPAITDVISDTLVELVKPGFTQPTGDGKIGDHAGVACDVYINRKEIRAESLIAGAKKRVWLLTTNLQSWAVNSTDYRHAANNGCDVRILALDPLHAFVNARERVLNRKQGQLRKEMAGAIESVFEQQERFEKERCQTSSEGGGSFQVRMCENFPTLMLFIVDDYLYVAFILEGSQSRDCVHLRFLASNSEVGGKNDAAANPVDGTLRRVCKQFIGHFEELWNCGQLVTRDVLLCNNDD